MTMIIDEKFARYILSLQSIAELERGLENRDREYRDQIEDSFPAIKEKRNDENFERWVQEEKIEKQPSVEKIYNKTMNKIQTSGSGHNDQKRQKVFAEINKMIELLDAERKKYYEMFMNDPKIRTEYKLLKTVKKLSKTS